MSSEITELLREGITKVSKRLKKREISSVELTRAFIARADEWGDICSYITRPDSIALSLAEEADRCLRYGKGGTLCGIPYNLKDNIVTSGVRTTVASGMLRDFVPLYSSTVYEKATEAGGVLLGKTNLDEFAMGVASASSYFGRVSNPLDFERSPGGSSGGSAASVAAGLAFWSLGTDTGGSSRQPAAFCGVTAMKPTYGLISRYGVVEFASSLDTVAPITLSVLDNATVLTALAGRDERDMTSLCSLEDYSVGISDGVAGLRVGIMCGYEKYCDDTAVRCVERAARALELLGARAEYTELPDAESCLDAYLMISSAEASSNLARYDGIKYTLREAGDTADEIAVRSRTNGFGDEVKYRIAVGSMVLSSAYHVDYNSLDNVRRAICKRVDEIFGEFDVILSPVTDGTAFYKNESDSLHSNDRFTVLANLTGCPAITIPAGGDGKMPCGISLMGKKLSEKMLYRVAYALESSLEKYVKEESYSVI